MERLDPLYLSEIILSAPGWARIGLTAPVEHLREQSARELALSIIEGLEREPDHPDQLAFSL